MFSLCLRNASKKLGILEMLEKLKAEKQLKLINDAKNQKACIFKRERMYQQFNQDRKILTGDKR